MNEVNPLLIKNKPKWFRTTLKHKKENLDGHLKKCREKYDKVQYTFMIKPLCEWRIWGYVLPMIKVIFKYLKMIL